MAPEDVSDRLGGDRSVRSVKGRVEMRLGGDFVSELGGLSDAVVVRGRGRSVVRVVAIGPWRDRERRR